MKSLDPCKVPVRYPVPIRQLGRVGSCRCWHVPFCIKHCSQQTAHFVFLCFTKQIQVSLPDIERAAVLYVVSGAGKYALISTNIVRHFRRRARPVPSLLYTTLFCYSLSNPMLTSTSPCTRPTPNRVLYRAVAAMNQDSSLYFLASPLKASWTSASVTTYGCPLLACALARSCSAMCSMNLR